MKSWRRLPQVSNQLFGCRVYINSDNGPINSFKRMLSQSNVDSSNTPLPELMNVKTVVNTALELYDAQDAKTVDEVRSIIKVSSCVIKAKVLKIVSDDGWFTYGCKACNKKAGHRILGASGEIIFECDNCGVVKDVWSKIRTVIRVQDTSGSTSLVLFENQLSKIVGRSVSWLNTKKDKCNDPHMLPVELEVILQKDYVFSINVTDFNLTHGYSTYTVDTLTDDCEVLSAIQAKLDSKDLVISNPDSLESTPKNKVNLSHTKDNGTTLDNDWTPASYSLKRKSESPPDGSGFETSTSKTVDGIASLKIPRMDEV